MASRDHTRPGGAALALVVDDSEDARDMYAQFPRYEGFRVELAADGFEGLDQNPERMRSTLRRILAGSGEESR